MNKYNKTKLAISISVALSTLVSFHTIADAKGVESKTAEVEVIEVTGVRSSLTSALAAKKNSENISDSIIAEEIGKSSDENIAEALSRISGISLDRNGGDNQTVTVRGISAALNTVKLNGVSMTSNTNDQAVDLGLFSADILSRIDVIKSPSANQEEGALGASINLQTRAPLSSKENINVVTVEARYNDLQGDTTPRFAYTFIQNVNDKIGFSGSLFHDQLNTRKEEYNIFNSSIRSFENAIDADTGEVIPGDTWAVSPNFYVNRINLDERTKKGGTATFQYRPNDSTDFRLDGSYSNQEFDHERSMTRMHNLHRTPNVTTIKLSDGNTANSIAAAKTAQIGGLNQSGRWLDATDTLILGAEIDHIINDYWLVKGKVGYSDTSQEISNAFIHNWTPYNTDKLPEDKPEDWCGITYAEGANGDNLPALEYCSGAYDGTDPSTLILGQIRSNIRDVSDSKTSAYVDFTRSFDNDFITSVEFGFKYTDRSKKVTSDGAFFNPDSYENPETIYASDVPGIETSSISGGSFLGGIRSPNMPTDWIYPDIDATNKLAFPNGVDFSLFELNPLKKWAVDEVTYGGYVQANFELLDGDLTGNFGVRYASTEINSHGSSGIRFNTGLDFLIEGEEFVTFPVTDEHEYDNWLPSVNISYLLEDDLILRASAARVLARTNLDSLRPGFEIKAQNIDEVPRASGGNTSLDPFLADQFDLSLEWYFEEGALLSGALFYKDFKSFSYNTQTSQEFNNPLTNQCIVDRSIYDDEDRLSATSPCADVVFSQTVNGGSAFVKGMELSYQQNYSFLPGFLSYLGTSINYTYADSEAIVDPENLDNPFNGLPFVNTSKHSANATVFWENDFTSLRLAYSYRTKAISKTAVKKSSFVRDDRGTLDFTASFDVTDNLKLSLSATNLTDSYDTFYDVVVDPSGHEADGIVREFDGDLSDITTDRISQLYSFGRNYRASLRYTF